jgi:hypothetical protein
MSTMETANDILMQEHILNDPVTSSDNLCISLIHQESEHEKNSHSSRKRSAQDLLQQMEHTMEPTMEETKSAKRQNTNSMTPLENSFLTYVKMYKGL